VTGGTLDEEHELTELVVVLRALADPANAVLVAAALEGLFFGCSPADLYDAQIAGMDFAIVRAPAEEHSAVGSGVARLHGWWLASRRCRPDQLVERILDESGILSYAASQPLGNGRAGALLRVGAVLRTAAGRGITSLSAAIPVIEAMLDQESDDSSLLPGRSDAVRIMNLHKAKGLEARIVVLAAPVKETAHPIRCHVRRTPEGRATGGLCITRMNDKRVEVLAHPEGWAAMEEAEAEFLAAEKQRLLYVAATRARRELLIARPDCMQASGPAPDSCLWRPLREAAEGVGSGAALEPTDAPGRRAAMQGVEEIRRRAADADSRRATAATPAFSVSTVTESAKADRELHAAYGAVPIGGTGLGAAWGRAVHRAVEGMGRGRVGESLAAFVEAVARDERLAPDEAGLAAAAARLTDVLVRIRGTDAWHALMASPARLLECPMVGVTHDGDREQAVEGVADAVLLHGDHCHVLDWKSDDVADGAWSERAPTYERQVAAYARIVRALTGLQASAELVRVGAA
jgi:ATP-dependent helicase/nuclease subunit A